MTTSSIRVLSVDDFGPFRHVLRSTLQKTFDIEHFYEACDGLEAVQKAQELQPDLILLDIGLPKLNGIEAARKIRALCPNTKIVFVSQQSSAEIIGSALNTGAQGYVVKTDVGSDLVFAVTAALHDMQFVSPRFGPERRDSEKGKLERSPQFMVGEDTAVHKAGFYSDDATCLQAFAHFISHVLNTGRVAIFVANELFRNSLCETLQRVHALDVPAAVTQGRYVPLDVDDVLSSFMVNGSPDRSRFMKSVDRLITEGVNSISKNASGVAACGICASTLWLRGNAEAAIKLEQLWNEAIRRYNLEVFCGYSLPSFQGGVGSHVFGRICAEHSAIRSR